MAKAKKRKKEKKWNSPEEFLDWMEAREDLPRIVKRVRPIMIAVISLIIVVIIWASVFNYVDVLINKPVKPNDNKMVIFEIKRGQSLSVVARNLQNENLIRNRWVFKLIADFSNKSDKLQAGRYYISKSMTNEQIINTFIRGVDLSDIIRVTLTEGMTVEDMVNKLSSEGLVKNKEELLKTLKSSEGYNDFDTIKELKNKDKRKYAMEGYLFPDTYEYYLSATDEEIVNKLVKRFDAVFDDEMKARAKKLGMTVDQIVTLASIIEREGKAADFTKISAVLHNRLKKDMALQCDTTIKYVTGNKHIVLDGDELKVDTLYNTYTYKGLPPGPICNPGKSALHAALYPDEKYVEEKYLYFITADPEKGNLVFSKTLDEHNKAVKKYRPLWEAYDKKNNS